MHRSQPQASSCDPDHRRVAQPFAGQYKKGCPIRWYGKDGLPRPSMKPLSQKKSQNSFTRNHPKMVHPDRSRSAQRRRSRGTCCFRAQTSSAAGRALSRWRRYPPHGINRAPDCNWRDVFLASYFLRSCVCTGFNSLVRSSKSSLKKSSRSTPRSSMDAFTRPRRSGGRPSPAQCISAGEHPYLDGTQPPGRSVQAPPNLAGGTSGNDINDWICREC